MIVGLLHTHHNFASYYYLCDIVSYPTPTTHEQAAAEREAEVECFLDNGTRGDKTPIAADATDSPADIAPARRLHRLRDAARAVSPNSGVVAVRIERFGNR